MSPQRQAAFDSLRQNTGVENIHLTRDTLPDWLEPSLPLHPSFWNLSAGHQCDYLRCYMLHVHGGGYSDIKPTSKCWIPFFDALDASSAVGAGYTEVGPHGVALVGGELERAMKENFDKLIGCGAMIFRPRSEFTTEWFKRLTALLDAKAGELGEHPAQLPADHQGAWYADGTPSRYPMAWTEVMGKIFHPLVYEYRQSILHLDLAPSFENYR
jgi:hypothetical protein